MTPETRTAPVFLAFDLGAESGRVMAGTLAEDRLATEEIHRFPNGPVAAGGRLYWDILRIWEEIQTGLARAAAAYGGRLAGVGVDSWGVDFGLLDRDGALLGNPFHYRDVRTRGMAQAASRTVPPRELFSITGIRPMDLNSLYQLLATADSGVWEAADAFLNIPDLLNHWLCGRMASEWTIASTTQCLDARRRDWSRDVLARFGIPAGMFQPVTAPGTILAELSPAAAGPAGCGRIPVIAVGSHDTASAVAAVPAADSNFLFLSSGTWSLMGAEVDDPVLDPRALECGFSNEGGTNGKYLLLKNISGLWPLQECRRAWCAEGPQRSYDSLVGAAREAAPFASFILPGEPRFLPPGDMPGRIREFCRSSGQPVPQSVGEVVRCILESLALEYRRTADQLAGLLGRAFSAVHIVGGGSRNHLLNQFAADALRLPVIAGPAEATALGNIIGQAVAVGRLGSWEEGRRLTQHVEPLTLCAPADGDAWEAAYARYVELAKNGSES